MVQYAQDIGEPSGPFAVCSQPSHTHSALSDPFHTHTLPLPHTQSLPTHPSVYWPPIMDPPLFNPLSGQSMTPLFSFVIACRTYCPFCYNKSWVRTSLQVHPSPALKPYSYPACFLFLVGASYVFSCYNHVFNFTWLRTLD